MNNNNDDALFVLYQHANMYMDPYSGSSLRQQAARRYVPLVGHIFLIPSLPVFALSP